MFKLLHYFIDLRRRRVPWSEKILKGSELFKDKLVKIFQGRGGDYFGSLEEELERVHFVRYKMYLDIISFISKYFHAQKLEDPRMIEFGGGTGFIQKIFNHPSYVVAEDYPVVDVQNLSSYKSNSYDFVILDQVLEHVADPKAALKEVYRILKKGGWLILTTPFLVQIHPAPHDYWRFTKEGMNELLRSYSAVRVKSWGNKEVALLHLERGRWLTTKEIKELGLFHLRLRNDEYYPNVVWAYAQK